VHLEARPMTSYTITPIAPTSTNPIQLQGSAGSYYFLATGTVSPGNLNFDCAMAMNCSMTGSVQSGTDTRAGTCNSVTYTASPQLNTYTFQMPMPDAWLNSGNPIWITITLTAQATGGTAVTKKYMVGIPVAYVPILVAGEEEPRAAKACSTE
jgi:hypothetical protein